LVFLNRYKRLRTSCRSAHKARSARGTNAKSASEGFGCGRWLLVCWFEVSIEDSRGKPATWPAITSTRLGYLSRLERQEQPCPPSPSRDYWGGGPWVTRTKSDGRIHFTKAWRTSSG